MSGDGGYNNHEVSAGFDPSRGLLTSAEVAVLYRVDINTVQGWARNGKIPRLRLPGGDWRFSKRWIYDQLGLSDG